MNYTDPRWQKKRLEILNRDQWRCVACGDDSNTLHVHHIVYAGELWETKDEDMQTLCESCHKKLGLHPAGGIGWAGDGDGFTWRHCPRCGSSDLKDKGSYDKCRQCGHSIVPDAFPSEAPNAGIHRAAEGRPVE